MSKNRRSDKECSIIVERYGRRKSGLEKLAYEFTESRFDTDYLSSITHLWLIETFVAGYELASSHQKIVSEIEREPFLNRKD